jgi:hypothetical protein
MKTKLSLRPISGTENFLRGDHTYQYQVEGELPPGERVSIAEAGISRRWQVFGTRDGVQATMDYQTAEDALAAVEAEFEK